MPALHLDIFTLASSQGTRAPCSVMNDGVPAPHGPTSVLFLKLSCALTFASRR